MSCRYRPLADHGGDFLPAIDSAQLDLALATRLKRKISAVSSPGSEPWVSTRRRDSSCNRSIVFVVRKVFQGALGKAKNVSSSSPPSPQTRHHARAAFGPRALEGSCRQSGPRQHWSRRRCGGSRRGSRRACTSAPSAPGCAACGRSSVAPWPSARPTRTARRNPALPSMIASSGVRNPRATNRRGTFRAGCSATR